MAIVINSNLRDVVTGIRDADVASVIETDFQPEVDKAVVINTNLQGDITGIRDTDIASESLIDDMMTGVRDVGGTAGPGGTGSNIMNPLDQMGFTNLGNDVVTNDLQTSWQGSLDKMPWDLFRPTEGNAKETGEFHLQSENYCTGYCFAEENPDGYTEVEWTYFADDVGVFNDDVGVTATQLQENCANGTSVKGGQLGYTEVEWTFIGDTIGGTAGPGGSTFTTGYDEAVGLDGYMVCPEPQWVMNNLIGSAGPGCDDI